MAPGLVLGSQSLQSPSAPVQPSPSPSSPGAWSQVGPPVPVPVVVGLKISVPVLPVPVEPPPEPLPAPAPWLPPGSPLNTAPSLDAEQAAMPTPNARARLDRTRVLRFMLLSVGGATANVATWSVECGG